MEPILGFCFYFLCTLLDSEESFFNYTMKIKLFYDFLDLLQSFCNDSVKYMKRIKSYRNTYSCESILLHPIQKTDFALTTYAIWLRGLPKYITTRDDDIFFLLFMECKTVESTMTYLCPTNCMIFFLQIVDVVFCSHSVFCIFVWHHRHSKRCSFPFRL